MVKEKEWLSVEDIQKKVNSLDITRKEISKERIREVLKEIEKMENNDLFRTIKDPNQTKKGRKRILYSKNFIPRVIEYFHEGFYFPNNQRLANAISKLLLTPLKVENSLPSSIKRSFRDFPQDKINFERRIYDNQRKLGELIQVSLSEYERKVQELQLKALFYEYRDGALQQLLSIKKLDPDQAMALINKLESAKKFEEVSAIQREIKHLKLKIRRSYE